MHPSSLGRVPSGALNSLNAGRPNHQQRTAHSGSSSSAFAQRRAEEPSHPPSSQSGGGNHWYYSSPGDPNNGLKSSQQGTATPSSTMIGPTSTFYNPDESLLQQQDTHQYQQWVTISEQQRQQQHQSQQMDFSTNYGHEVAQGSQAPLQNPYAYMQAQYSATAPLARYSASNSGTVTQASVGDPDRNGMVYQPQINDVYPSYYPDMLPVPNHGSASESPPERGQSYPTPESTLHSYSNSPDPAYQQQHPQQAFTQSRQSSAAPPPQLSRPQPSYPLHPSQLQQNPPQRFSNQPDLSDRRSQAPHPNAPSSTHSSSLSPPSIAQWNSGVHYSTANLNANPSSQGFKVTNNNSTANKPAGPSQNKTIAPNPAKHPPATANTDHAPQRQQAAPAPGNSIFITEKVGPNERKRKRPRRNGSTEDSGHANGDGASDDDSDDDVDFEMGGGISVGMGGLGVVGSRKREKGSRLPGACTHCKKLKMKCDFPKHEDTCKRCKVGGHVCIVEGRRPRNAPNKREYLLAQIRQKDAIIESLLKQLHNPYLATPLSIASYRMATSPSDHNNRNVLAWLDRLQASVRDTGMKSGAQSFMELRKLDADGDDSDLETESKRTEGQHAPSTTREDGDGAADDDTSHDIDKIQSALPDSHVPLGLIADLSLSNSKASRKKDRSKDLVLNDDDLNDDNVGVANETYFMPGPATDLGIRATLIEQHSPPEILVHGLVKPEDVEKLFEVFYERVNPFISLLDPVLHTPASTFARCPFLFTVICAISSRYYSEKSEIYPIAMHFAKHSAANALTDGWKSVELCQAYILMSIYAVPARRWEEDRSWLYTGLAIRIATDLNLHQVNTTKPHSEKQEREILNKTRVWMICFNLDRSTATQFGKPSTIKEDFIVRGARDWYKKSKYNLNHDVHLCAYSALLQIVAKFHDEIFSDPSSPSGLNKKVDFRKVTLAHDATLTRYHEEWAKRFEQDSDPKDPSSAFRCLLLPFLVGYSRLVMFSFGFQQAYQRGVEHADSIFFSTCLSAAKAVIDNMINGLAPSGYMRYAPDGHFVFACFASAFLLKLLKSDSSSSVPKEQQNAIFDLIGRLIQTLSSPKIAIDDRHTPKLYARFLAKLLSLHRRDGNHATVGRLHTMPQVDVSSQISSASPASNPGQKGTVAHSAHNGFAHGTNGQKDPVFTSDATFVSGAGHIDFGNDFDMTYGGTEEEMLATMQAIDNPAWWKNMMMPGFSWPEASPSPPVTAVGPPSYQSMSMPGVQSSFGIFHGTHAPT